MAVAEKLKVEQKPLPLLLRLRIQAVNKQQHCQMRGKSVVKVALERARLLELEKEGKGKEKDTENRNKWNMVAMRRRSPQLLQKAEKKEPTTSTTSLEGLEQRKTLLLLLRLGLMLGGILMCQRRQGMRTRCSKTTKKGRKGEVKWNQKRKQKQRSKTIWKSR
jgi:hypothetical protein